MVYVNSGPLSCVVGSELVSTSIGVTHRRIAKASIQLVPIHNLILTGVIEEGIIDYGVVGTRLATTTKDKEKEKKKRTTVELSFGWGCLAMMFFSGSARSRKSPMQNRKRWIS